MLVSIGVALKKATLTAYLRWESTGIQRCGTQEGHCACIFTLGSIGMAFKKGTLPSYLRGASRGCPNSQSHSFSYAAMLLCFCVCRAWIDIWCPPRRGPSLQPEGLSQRQSAKQKLLLCTVPVGHYTHEHALCICSIGNACYSLCLQLIYVNAIRVAESRSAMAP